MRGKHAAAGVAASDAASRDAVGIEPEGSFASPDTVNERKRSVSCLGCAADMGRQNFAVFDKNRRLTAHIV